MRNNEPRTTITATFWFAKAEVEECSDVGLAVGVIVGILVGDWVGAHMIRELSKCFAAAEAVLQQFLW